MSRNVIVPALVGVVIGAAVTLGIGLPTGWLLTGQQADAIAETAAVDSLVPLCVARFRKAPDAPALLAELKAMNPWSRTGFVKDKGWAEIPGAEVPDGVLADACAVHLAHLD